MVDAVTIELSGADCWLILHGLVCLMEKHPEDESAVMNFRNRLAEAIHEQKVEA